MELNLHTSIMVVAAILVLLILVDGLKRVLAARAEHRRLLAKNTSSEKEDLELLKGELPSGGARSVSAASARSKPDKQEPPYARPLSRTESRTCRAKSTESTPTSIGAVQSKSKTKTSKPAKAESEDRQRRVGTESGVLASAQSDLGVHSTGLAKRHEVVENRLSQPQEGNTPSESSVQNVDASATSLEVACESVDISGPVPMLMESVQLGELSEKLGQACGVEQIPLDKRETETTLVSQSTSDEATQVTQGSSSGNQTRASSVTASVNPAADLPKQNEPEHRGCSSKASLLKDPLFDEFDDFELTESLPTQKATTTQITTEVGERLADRPPSEEVLVIHVFSKQVSGFEHKKLFALFKACDLRFGEMSIFHRFERANAQGNIQFSVADVIKPGAFNLDQPHQSTPGIALFMSLPGPLKPIEAFDAMAEVARVVARNLEGVVKDEMLSVMTTQTLEHCRQRIHDFNRRQQLAKHSFA